LTIDSISGRPTADAPTYGVTAISGATMTLAGTPALEPGDEVVIVGLRGGRNGNTISVENVGAWELARVESVNGDVVQLRAPIQRTYGETSNDDLTDRA